MSSPRTNLPGGPFSVLLFDMDGVLTDTASVHATAWKATFDEFLQLKAKEDGTTFVPFDAAKDYSMYVDGKPRNDGVRSFIESRGYSLPEGDPSSAPGDDTVWAVGNRKNALLVSVLEEQGVEVYDGSVEFIKAARSEGYKVGVVSSSANTKAVLASAGITDLFDTRVDGVTLIEEKIAGKPAPDSYVEAARRLGADPKDAVVFEDALSGVAAGRAGGFGLVIGVDRVGQAAALKEHGADLVVDDVSELLWHGQAETGQNERP